MMTFRPWMCAGAALICTVAWAQGAKPISRSYAVTVKVADFAAATQQLTEFGRTSDAEPLGKGSQGNDKGRTSGWFRFSVSNVQAEAFLASIRSLGKVYGEKAEQSNHEGEIEELKMRSVRLGEHSDRLKGILASDKRMRGGDILFLQDRLLRATIDHDLLRLETKKLENTGQKSTVNVRLFEPSPGQRGEGEGFWGLVKNRLQDGTKALIGNTAGFLLWLVEKAIYLVILVPLYLVFRKQWAKRQSGAKMKSFLLGESEERREPGE